MTKTDPIELHYWPTPNGWKISIMLEECQLPYEVHYVDILKGQQFEPDFLKIAPNNRMPAIVDPAGPDGKSVSVFESGAILQYLGEKTGLFYPANPRDRIVVNEWLFWQMAGLGPMAGQAHHFSQYAKEKIPYAIERYERECGRLYGVMNKQLETHEYLAGDYSIADMACFGWVIPYKRQGQNLKDFPHLNRWFRAIADRPAVKRGTVLGEQYRKKPSDLKDNKAARNMLFGSGQKKRN